MKVSSIEHLKICAIRETLEETGIWPFDNKVRDFNYNENHFEEFLLSNRINIQKLLHDQIRYWFTWRTPENERVFKKQWDMSIFVTEVNDFSKRKNYSSPEAVETEWYDIDFVLKKCKNREIHLAPPQWFMLKEMEKIQDFSTFFKNLSETEFPIIIQPKLICDENESEWHSVLPGDHFYEDSENLSTENVKSPAHRLRRIKMKRDGEVFYDFQMIER